MKILLVFSLFLFACGCSEGWTFLNDCPCSSAELCKPVTKQYKKELIVFGDASLNYWKLWNWTEITNVILTSFTNASELYCYAHSKNVRVTVLVGLDKTKFHMLVDKSFRTQVITSWVNEFTSKFLDGINLDIEGSALTKEIVDGISALSYEAYQTVKKINSNYLVTFDVYYSPYLADCISYFCYNYTALAASNDYLIAMDYDATLDLLIANSNSPLNLLEQSYDQYINELHIPAEKFVMAVPWYGYDYTCGHFYNGSGGDVCVIVGSGSGSSQRIYADISAQFRSNLDGMKWWPKAETPYFTVKEDGVYHQFQFDNVKSLTLKYQLALKLKLHGIGMFEANFLNYTSTDPKVKQETAEMWNTISNYVQLLKFDVLY